MLSETTGTGLELFVRDQALDDNQLYLDDEFEHMEGLLEFLMHSDCDGEISPEMCVKVANDLEQILPRVEALNWPATGHIEQAGGFVQVLKNFIDGCRLAAENDEPLTFR